MTLVTCALLREPLKPLSPGWLRLFHSHLIQPWAEFVPHHNNDAACEFYNKLERCDAFENKQAHRLECSAYEYSGSFCVGSRTSEFIGGYAIR